MPYLQRGGVRLVGPEDRGLKGALAALQVERYLSLKPSVLERFLRLYGEAMPAATRAGRRLRRTGALRTMSDSGAPASEVLRRVSEEVAPAP